MTKVSVGVLDLDEVMEKKVANNRKRYLIDDKLECPKCGEWKTLDGFHKNVTGIYGASLYCKECANRNSREHHAENNAPGKPNAKNHRRYHKNYHLVRTYGINIEEYDEILASQDGRCDICKIELFHTKGSMLAHLDHCHATLKVRGILCVRCNQGIGCMQENIEIMNNAIKYIEKHTKDGDDKV